MVGGYFAFSVVWLVHSWEIKIIMTLSFRKIFLLLALTLSAGEAAAQVTSLPSTMILTGKVASSSDGKVVPVEGDSVLVVNPANNKTEASGIVSQGVYTLILSGTNGTALALNLMHSGTIYTLLFTDGSNAAFTLSGSFLPVRTTMNVVASSHVVGTTPPPGTTPPATTPPGTTPPPSAQTGDLNSDGVVNEVDVGLLKQAISGEIPLNSAKMDINSDHVVNTRDLIDLIRMVREQSHARMVPVSIIPSIIPVR